MSEFSLKCNTLFAESNYTMYKFSKTFNLDATTLRRMLNGQRLPNIDFVESFCESLRVTPYERKEILELYEIELIGRPIFERRKQVKKLIENFAAYDTMNNEAFLSAPSCSEIVDKDSQHLKTKMQLSTAIQTIIGDELLLSGTPKIYTNIPTRYSQFFQILSSLYTSTKKDISIIHLISLCKDSMNNNTHSNLDTLFDILPFSSSSYNGYTPLYIHSRITFEEWSSQLMPYYIITSQYILFISADLAGGILKKEKVFINQYLAELNKKMHLYQPLIKRYTTPNEFFEAYRNSFEAFGYPSYIIESHPCHNWMDRDYLTDNLLIDGVADTKLLAQAFKKYLEHVNSNWPVKLFFTDNGLDEFANTGKLANMYSPFIPSKNDARIQNMLKNLKDSLVSMDMKIIDSNKFNISSSIYIEIYPKAVTFISSPEPLTYIYCIIKESSICEAFIDFCKYLQESNYVYSNKDAINLLDSYTN